MNVKDGFGNEIKKGDRVLYCSPIGSRNLYTLGTITELIPNQKDRWGKKVDKVSVKVDKDGYDYLSWNRGPSTKVGKVVTVFADRLISVNAMKRNKDIK